MDREVAKEFALKTINELIEKEGEDKIHITAPQVGKNSWTLKEMKEAILEDKTLENSGFNPIDGVINLHKLLKERGRSLEC